MSSRPLIAAALAALFCSALPLSADPGEAASTGPPAGLPACCAARTTDARPSSEAPDAKTRRLAEFWEAARGSRNPYLGTAWVEELRAREAAAQESGDPEQRFGAEWALGELLLHVGELDESITRLQEAVTRFESSGAGSQRLLDDARFGLAMAYFRRAERRNCISHHTAESCIFPLQGGAVHVDPEDARHAKGILEELLQRPETHRAAEATWLLNVTHMALGTWPDGVPEAFRIGPERFRSAWNVRRFDDIAGALGVDRFGRAGSVVVDDFTGDVHLDILTCAFDPDQSLRLFRNGGDGTFQDITAAAGLAGQLGGIGLVQGDADGDGLLDLLVLRGGGLGRDGEIPGSLLRQVEPGRFEDVTAAAGIEIAAPTRTAAFADIDADGDLDLFVGYETEADGEGGVRYPSRLWRNRGDGTFDDVTAAAGIDSRAACVGAVFGDIDGDLAPDLYLSLRDAPNVLWRNRGDGTFEDATAEAGVTEPAASSAVILLDTDHDGDLDLFVGHANPYGTALAEVARYYRDGPAGTPPSGPSRPETPRLYRNDGGGRFTDVTAEQGLAVPVPGDGAASGDLDGDGFLDLYLTTGNPEMSALWPNLLFRNRVGTGFTDVTEASGTGHLQKGAAAAFADLDLDGDQDLFLQTGGWHLDDGFGDVLFRNPTDRKSHVRVALRGVTSNRFGVGAVLRLRVRERNKERFVYRHVGTMSSTGGNPLRQDIALGRASRVLYLEVLWPTGERQRFFQPPMNCTLTLTEGQEKLEADRTFPFTLGPPQG